MVTMRPFETDSARRDRAQLILVGAVAIAIVVLGLVVVFNTVLYTDNVAASGAVSEPDEAREMSREVKVNSKYVIAGVNANGIWESKGDAMDAVNENLTTYRNGLSNASALSASAIVSFEEGDDTERKFGARVADVDGNEFEDVAGDKNWSVTSSGQGVLVRDFEMTVDTGTLGGETTEEAFRVVFQSESGSDHYTVWIYEDDSSNDVAIRTLTDDDTGDPIDGFGSEASDECILSGSGSDDNVTIDLSAGEIPGYESCADELNVTDGIPDGQFRTVDYVRGDNVTGEYSMVVWRNDPDPTSYMSSTHVTPPGGITPGMDSPYWTYAPWQIELTVQYETQSATFADTYILEVYNRSR